MGRKINVAATGEEAGDLLSIMSTIIGIYAHSKPDEYHMLLRLIEDQAKKDGRLDIVRQLNLFRQKCPGLDPDDKI